MMLPFAQRAGDTHLNRCLSTLEICRVALLEEVFKLSGVPTITFVEPVEYDALKVSIRTPGRCCVIEGPSGIGKTSSVIKILQELGIEAKATLSLAASRMTCH